MTIYHNETITTPDGETFTQLWHCSPAPTGARYQVVREEWTDDYTTRHIYAVCIITGRHPDSPSPPPPGPRLPNPGRPTEEHWSQALYPVVIALAVAVVVLAWLIT